MSRTPAVAANPSPSSWTPVTGVAEFVEAFDLLGDWESRYQYLIELGEGLETMPQGQMVEENRVKQCMSTVFVHAGRDTECPGRIVFHGYCDTSIIRGVVALLVRLFSGKTPHEVVRTDVDELFENLHLEEHLSPNRHVGIYAIVDKMKAQAAAFLA